MRPISQCGSGCTLYTALSEYTETGWAIIWNSGVLPTSISLLTVDNVIFLSELFRQCVLPAAGRSNENDSRSMGAVRSSFRIDERECLWNIACAEGKRYTDVAHGKEEFSTPVLVEKDKMPNTTQYRTMLFQTNRNLSLKTARNEHLSVPW